jgi:hypothetical protein
LAGKRARKRAGEIRSAWVMALALVVIVREKCASGEFRTKPLPGL